MGREDVDSRRIVLSCALSVGAHAAIVVVAGGLLLARALLSGDGSRRAELARASSHAEDLVEIELPGMVEGSVVSESAIPPRVGTPLPRGGGEGEPRPDTGRAGLGGTNAASQLAINLADRDDATLLQPEVRSRMDRNQIQRLDTARARSSREDWRASRDPTELTFVAIGKGSRAERLKAASSDPSSGARAAAAPSRRGATVGAEQRPEGIGEARRDPGGAEEGGPVASPGLGIRDGRQGPDHRASADVMDARPMVAQGTPSIPSNEQGKPRDTTDSEQEVAAAMQSIVHASTAGGARGVGPGGQNGPGSTGSGGVEGAGSKAKALGSGSGSGTDNDLRDTRRMMYLRKVMAKIHPLWANAFPRWAALEGMQGTAIVTFVLGADGSVTSASVSRPSGVPEFDENLDGQYRAGQQGGRGTHRLAAAGSQGAAPGRGFSGY